MRSLFYLLAVCLLSSCSTISYVGIETYNPSEVTFPGLARKVLIVNNALPQPPDVGYECKLFGVNQDTCRIDADSALYDACKSLGKSLVDASYFNDVLLYNGRTRTDNAYYSDAKLTEQQVNSLCEETGADAVISIDRLLFKMDKNVVAFAEGYLMGLVNVYITGVVRAYLPRREQPLATVYVSDSLFWSESADNQVMLTSLIPGPNDALRAAGQYIGAKAYVNFVPHWESESRWFFTGVGARWKEASAYASAGKWTSAAERWQYIHTHSTGWKSVAKTASNLALSCEMAGDLPKAYEWASQSYALFKANAAPDSQELKLLQLYVQALGDRIRSDKKLNMQFGEE